MDEPVHFQPDTFSAPACDGRLKGVATTTDPVKVTCGNCRRTGSVRTRLEMIELLRSTYRG